MIIPQRHFRRWLPLIANENQAQRASRQRTLGPLQNESATTPTLTTYTPIGQIIATEQSLPWTVSNSESSKLNDKFHD